MLKSLIYLCAVIVAVKCGQDLCKNGAKLDSITYIDNQDMWFFTSGGFYWLIKAGDFPPKTDGQPLPGGLKRGDAAIYKNTLDGCAASKNPKKPQEQELHVIEMVNGQNMILTFDIRSHEWADKPVPYNQLNGLGQAKIDWTKPIDAAFTYKVTNIVVIQGKRYSIVDLKGLCEDPNGFGNGQPNQPILDLNVQTTVDATSGFSDKYFYLFQDQVFWKIEITNAKLSDGKLTTIKNMQQDIVTEFFKFQENCKLPPKDAAETTVAADGGGPVGQAQTEAGTQASGGSGTQDGATVAESNAEQTTKKSKDGGGFPWIIVIIVIIVVIIIAIILIACLAMQKKSPEDKEKGAEGADAARTAAAGSRAAPGSKVDGTSPSSMSVRSGVGASAKTGAAAGGVSKTGSKADGKGLKASASSMGTSPSTISVRSNAGLVTSKSASKTGK